MTALLRNGHPPRRAPRPATPPSSRCRAREAADSRRERHLTPPPPAQGNRLYDADDGDNVAMLSQSGERPELATQSSNRLALGGPHTLDDIRYPKVPGMSHDCARVCWFAEHAERNHEQQSGLESCGLAVSHKSRTRRPTWVSSKDVAAKDVCVKRRCHTLPLNRLGAASGGSREPGRECVSTRSQC